MSTTLTDSQLTKLINSSISNLENYIFKLKSNEDPKIIKKSSLISYWVNDYTNYLYNEKTFSPRNLIKYKRGNIIQVNFGYRIGCELGGKHFAMVLDNNNSIKNNLITVLPFTSVKPNTKKSIFTYRLETGIYELHIDKWNSLLNSCETYLDEINNSESFKNNKLVSDEEYKILSKKLAKADQQVHNGRKIEKAIMKLKDGTIIQLGQIITISKQRIINPKNPSDILANIKVTPDDLNKINYKLKKLYIYNDNS